LAAHLAQQIPKGTFESAGAALGGAAGRGLATFTGVGDYVFNDIVHTPSMPTREQSQKWSISNCEYVTDLFSGGAGFNLSNLSLQPTDATAFPWLSRVAMLYQKYRFKQLIFEFRSNCSDYAASGPLGNVIFSPVYNVLADVPTSKQQLEAFAHAVSTKPSNSIMCGVECDPRDSNVKWYYVRNPSTAATQFTDMGAFYYATNGLAAASGLALGEIWVHYTIEFDEPILAGVSSPQAYARVGVTNNSAGLVDTTFAGMRATGSTVTFIDQQDTTISNNVSQFRSIGITAGLPVGTPYFVNVDNAAALTNGTRLWFAATGTYQVTYYVSLSMGYTTVTLLQPLYTAAVSGGNGSVVAREYVAPTNTAGSLASGVVAFSGSFDVVVTTPNLAVDFTKNAAQVTTGSTGVTIVQSYGCYVRITKL
jgi:hypothetical protein